MSWASDTLLFCGTLLLGIAICLEVGRRIGIRGANAEPRPGQEALQGSVAALMGLLIAFTFSDSLSRWEQRRELMVKEVNSISTAHLRLELLPGAVQPGIAQDLRSYVEQRILLYSILNDSALVRTASAELAMLQGRIWSVAVASSDTLHPSVRQLVLPSMNAMFDAANERVLALQAHTPDIVFHMLFVLVLGSSLLAGHGMGRRSGRLNAYSILYTLLIVASVYLILDLQYPRFGLIRNAEIDAPLRALLRSM